MIFYSDLKKKKITAGKKIILHFELTFREKLNRLRQTPGRIGTHES